MHHVIVAGKSLLIGDEMTAVLLRYAAHLARIGSADDVAVRAIGPDGSDVVVQMLLNSGTVLVAESTTSTVPEPDNTDLVAYIETQLAQFDLPTG